MAEINEKRDEFDRIIEFMNSKFKKLLKNLSKEKKDSLQEIRIRAGMPTVIVCSNNSFVLDRSESVATPVDIKEIFNLLCGYSVYSFENQIKKGFITIDGGHRIGLCGEYVFSGDKISAVNELTSLNIRIAREFPNCSEDIFEKIKNDFLGALIVGPPCCGKTTIIRDLSRRFSLSEKLKLPKTCIIDERLEIASCHGGKVQFNIGLSDVLSGIPKSAGIMMAVRCMSPNIIICDEIGTSEEAMAVKSALNCGVKIIATIHAFGLDDFLKKPQSMPLVNSGAFEKIIFLDGENFGKIKEIYSMEELYDKNYRNYTFNNVGRSERIHIL